MKSTVLAVALVGLCATSALAWSDAEAKMAVQTCGNVLNCNKIPGARCENNACNLGVCPTDGTKIPIITAGYASPHSSVPCNGGTGEDSQCSVSTVVTFSVDADAVVDFSAGACSVPLGEDIPAFEWSKPHLAISMNGSGDDSVCTPLAQKGEEELCYETNKSLMDFTMAAGTEVTAYLCGAQGAFTFSVIKDANLDLSQGTGQGDPHFTGFDGRPFDYEGEPGAIFNVVSTPTVNVNAALVPELINGLTYMGSVGVTTSDARISITANPETESLIIEANDEVVDSANLGGGVSVTRVDAQTVTVDTDALSLILAMRHNQFVDITSAALNMEPTADNIHGVLGQTAMPERTFAGYVGEQEEYYVTSIFSSDFAENRFTGSAAARSVSSAYRTAKQTQFATATNNNL